MNRIFFRFRWNDSSGYSRWFELTEYTAEGMENYKELYQDFFHNVWIEYQ